MLKEEAKKIQDETTRMEELVCSLLNDLKFKSKTAVEEVQRGEQQQWSAAKLFSEWTDEAIT